MEQMKDDEPVRLDMAKAMEDQSLQHHYHLRDIMLKEMYAYINEQSKIGVRATKIMVVWKKIPDSNDMKTIRLDIDNKPEARIFKMVKNELRQEGFKVKCRATYARRILRDGHSIFIIQGVRFKIRWDHHKTNCIIS
jgi:hypothetical protein